MKEVRKVVLALVFAVCGGASYLHNSREAEALPPKPPPPHCIDCVGDSCVATYEGVVECTMNSGPGCTTWGTCFRR